MPKLYFKALCACGNEAIVSKSKDGHTRHLCAGCLSKPPPQQTRLRERDSRMLRQLGLIA